MLFAKGLMETAAGDAMPSWRRKVASPKTILAPIVVCLAVALAGCQTADEEADTSPEPLTLSGEKSDIGAGKLHFMNGNYGLAEKYFRKAVESRADNAEAWLGLAASYDRLGRFDFADRAYDQLIKIAGRQPRIVNNLGYSHLLRGNKMKARDLFLEAKAALPGDPVIEANLAMLDGG